MGAGQGHIGGLTYLPSGVRFTSANSYLAGTAPVSANSSKFVYSAWWKISGCSATNGNTGMNGCFTNFTAPVALAGDGSESTQGFVPVLDNAGGNYITLRLNLGDSTAGTIGGSNVCLVNGYYPSFIDNGWHHIFLTGDTSNTGSATKNVAFYFDDVLIASNCVYGGGSGAMTLGFNLRNWQVRSPITALDGNSPIELADVLLDTTTSAVCTSSSPITVDGTSFACSGAGVVPAGVRARFISGGKPVNAKTAGSGGSWALGRQPEIFLSGNKTGFVTNQGSYASLTSVPAFGANLYTSIWGPGASAPAHTAYDAWETGGFGNGAVTTITASNGGNPIIAGDILLVGFRGRDTTATDRGLSSCPAAFPTQVARIAPTANTDLTSMICARVADGSENAGVRGDYTVSTTLSSAYTGGFGYWMVDIRGSSGLDGAATTTFTTAGAGVTSITAPTITTTQAGDTILTVFDQWRSALNGATTRFNATIPRTGDVILTTPSPGAIGQTTIVQQTGVAQGTTTAVIADEKSGYTNSTGLAEWFNVVTIALKAN